MTQKFAEEGTSSARGCFIPVGMQQRSRGKKRRDSQNLFFVLILTVYPLRAAPTLMSGDMMERSVGSPGLSSY